MRPDVERPDLEESDRGLARERTNMAWTRTAISFAALGAAILKDRLVPGLIVLALGLATWILSRFLPWSEGDDRARPRQMLLVTVAVTAVAAVSLGVALTARK
jgi:uncharacterized membrane protein YidH (DUF202 family)